MKYQALLVVSFGGPEGPDDVMPFLENVCRGKNVPRERLLEVAEHYYHFDGKSPINDQNLAFIAALREDFKANGIDLPIYYGNRNWKPFLTTALEEMKKDGVTASLAFFTSLFSCYSGCRQYRENIIEARKEVGGAPTVEKVRMGYNHPGFIEAMADRVNEATDKVGKDSLLLFTAHSIPNSMAENCNYEKQLQESCRLVAEQAGCSRWRLVYQSRSGPPQIPWLEPDVCDVIEGLEDEKSVVVAPIGFVSDHLEVMFDLDTEAKEACEERGIKFARAGTVGTHPKYVAMARELVQERLGLIDSKRALGQLGPSHDVCPADCCLYTPSRRPAAKA